MEAEVAKASFRESFIGPKFFIGITYSLTKLILRIGAHMPTESFDCRPMIYSTPGHTHKALFNVHSAKHWCSTLEGNGIHMLTSPITGHNHMSNLKISLIDELVETVDFAMKRLMLFCTFLDNAAPLIGA